MKAANSGCAGHHTNWHVASEAKAIAKLLAVREKRTWIFIWFVKRDFPQLRAPKLRRQAPSSSWPVSVVIDCIQYLLLMPYSHRDMHGLTLHAVNSVLGFAGFPTINRIQDFNLVNFYKHCLQLEASSELKTEKQHVFLQYFDACKKRNHNGKPANYNPEATVCIESLKKNTDTNSIII